MSSILEPQVLITHTCTPSDLQHWLALRASSCMEVSDDIVFGAKLDREDTIKGVLIDKDEVGISDNLADSGLKISFSKVKIGP